MAEFFNMNKFLVIAGPCAIESEEKIMFLAEEISKIMKKYDVEYYFKASFDKANRTSALKYRGPGIDEGLRILKRVKDELGIPVCTDIHEPWQAEKVGEVADIIQIPAFLCRQTDLLEAAAKTGKIINVKKAQFLSPEEMGNVVGKLEYFGNKNIMLCERGTTFGYNSLIVDMSGLVKMKQFGYPVVFDATHSVQISGGGEGFGNSGKREFVPYLAKAAMATGVLGGIFMEVHDDPDSALCDGTCMLRLDKLDRVMAQLMDINEINKKYSEE